MSADSPPSSSAMEEWRRDFVDLSFRYGVVSFGSFTLKSGRKSPYFFNAGYFSDGFALHQLARAYAHTIIESKIEFDALFGPAYKGIPLASATAVVMSSEFGLNYPYIFNRKEVKDHGEGGELIGAKDMKEGTRVLIIDDVMTAGIAVGETLEIFKKLRWKPVGIVVSLDRQEIPTTTSTISDTNCTDDHEAHRVSPATTSVSTSPSTEGVVADTSSFSSRISTLQKIERQLGLPIKSVIKFQHLLTYTEEIAEGRRSSDAMEKGGNINIEDLPNIIKSIRDYRQLFGVDDYK